MFFSKKSVYADAAAAIPLIPEARKRLVELLDVYGNPGGLHKESVVAKEALESARKEIAGTIGAHADEIVFTASGTEANNLALEGVIDLYEGRKIAVSTLSTEHPSVLETLKAYEGYDVKTSYVKVDGEGIASIGDIKESISDKTALVSVALINSELGVLQDVRGIAKVLRGVRKERIESRNTLPILFHIDASQAPLWMRLQVDQLHPDLMTLDAQKCGGPKGVGLLYVREGVELSSQIRGGDQERGLRAGTENVPLVGAFAVALSVAQKNCEENAARVRALRDLLLAEIQKKIPSVVVNGSVTSRVANNLNISIPGLLGEMAVIALSAKGVAASTRSACSTSDEDASHVLSAIGADSARAQSALRFTLLPTVTEADIERIAKALVEVYERYRQELT